MNFLIPLVVIALLAWVFLVLPQRRRSRAHMQMQDAVALGDAIITAGGMHAVVTELGDEVIGIEIAPGTAVRLDRRAVAAIVRPELEHEEGPILS